MQVKVLPEWSNSYGTFYPHYVTFENGDVAITNKTKENAFSVGQELQYELVGEDNVGNQKFKEYRENPSQSQGQGSNASFALSYAKDITVARITTGLEADKELMNDLIKTANIFNKWLNEN